MGDKITPSWAKTAAKRLIDLGMTRKELAGILHVNYTQLCNVLRGHVVSPKIAGQICTYLNVQEDL